MSETTAAAEFFERALQEARRYGDDPWVFLRELTQNSRDAGATRIDFETAVEGGWQRVTCRDNGRGMSYADLERYFLRLYASSKERQADAIGFFGVGFWSTLLFEPARIRVVAASGTEAHALDIDCRRRRVAAAGTAPRAAGTEISLFRRAGRGRGDATALAEAVRAKLAHYAGHVRPAAGAGELALSCNGERLNRPFAVPAKLGRRFDTKRFDGAIGFGPRPSVQLYQHGLLARDLTALDQVIPSRRTDLPAFAGGFHPVIRLNIDGLELLMDRQRAVEDPLLHEAVDYCEDLLRRMHGRMVRRLFPMDWRNRALRTGIWLQRQRVAIFVLAAFLALTLLGLRALRRHLPEPAVLPALGKPSASRPRPVIQALEGWRGPSVDHVGTDETQWAFRYDGPELMLFRLNWFADYDPERGFAPREPGRLQPFADLAPAEEADVSVSLWIPPGAQLFPAPIPPGYAPARQLLNEEPVYKTDAAGTIWIQESGPKSLIYRLARRQETTPPRALTPSRRPWPTEYADAIQRAKSQAPHAVAAQLEAWLRRRFVYTRNPETVERFRRAPGTWLERATQLEVGDCDVINGVYALMLQSAGVPARLEVGLVGQNGRARSELHAWTAYFDGAAWRTTDLTERFAARSGLAGPVIDSLGPPLDAPAPMPPQPTAAPEQETPASMPPSPVAATSPQQSARWPYWAAGLGIAALAAIMLARRRRPAPIDPEYAADLFRYSLQSSSDRDPFQMRFRPLLLTLGGRRLSYSQAQKLAQRGRLLAASPDLPLPSRLRGRDRILDSADPMFAAMAPFLPPPSPLDELAPALASPSLPEPWRRTAFWLRGLDPGLRLFILPDSDQLYETQAPFTDRSLGRRQITIGAQHPICRRLMAGFAKAPAAAAFAAIHDLLHGTTLYLMEKDEFLRRLARRIEAEAS